MCGRRPIATIDGMTETATRTPDVPASRPPERSAVPELRRPLTLLAGLHRPLVVFAAAMVLTGLVSAGGLLFDDRILIGAPIWLKPLKFSLSLGLYALTLAWMLSLLRRWHRLGWWMGTVAAVAGGLEMVI